MIKHLYKSIMFRLVSFLSTKELTTGDKVVYLTFDDGPEPVITEFILGILRKYDAKATFFCVGKNFEKYPYLVELIKSDGHSLGNHTFSHLSGHNTDSNDYLNDVTKGKELIQTNLFRPPWGELTFRNFLKIRRCNRIIMWSISSCDFVSNTHWNDQCKKMVSKTKSGSIILFHFSLKHAVGTKEILSRYIDDVSKLGYSFNSIEFE